MYTCLFISPSDDSLYMYLALIYLLGTRQAQMIWHLCMSRFIPLKQSVSYICISIYSWDRIYWLMVHVLELPSSPVRGFHRDVRSITTSILNIYKMFVMTACMHAHAFRYRLTSHVLWCQSGWQHKHIYTQFLHSAIPLLRLSSMKQPPALMTLSAPRHLGLPSQHNCIKVFLWEFLQGKNISCHTRSRVSE